MTCNGRVVSVGSEGSARSQYSWLELLPRVEENALAEKEAKKLLRQVAVWLKLYKRGQQRLIPKPKPKPKPKPDADPEPDFGM